MHFLELFLDPTSTHFYELYLISDLWDLQPLRSQITSKQLSLPLPAILLWSVILAHSSCFSRNMLKIYEICLHWSPQKFQIFPVAHSWFPLWPVLALTYISFMVLKGNIWHTHTRKFHCVFFTVRIFTRYEDGSKYKEGCRNPQ